MKKISARLCLAAIALSLFSACATFASFNPQYVKDFRKELNSGYACFESLELSIGYGDDLLVECRVDEDTGFSQADDIYGKLISLLSSEELINDYLSAIDYACGYAPPEEPYESVEATPEIIVDFYIGDEHYGVGLLLYAQETVDSHDYEHTAYVYYGFPGWPEDKTNLGSITKR